MIKNAKSKVSFKCRHIGFFPLFLAWGIIFAHSVIPHHHHFDILYADHTTDCEFMRESSKSKHHLQDCHALNILAKEKSDQHIEKSVSPKSIQLFFDEQKIEVAYLPEITFLHFEEKVAIPKTTEVSFHALRSPPVFC